MVANLVFYQLALIALLWVFLMLSWVWPSEPAAARPIPPTPVPPPCTRSTAPTPFAGLPHTPHCEACAQGVVSRPQAPCPPPPRLVPTRGRPRHVDTSRHFCPHPTCAYRGWVGLGNLRANGPPRGDLWRQLHGTACESDFLETHGTPLHGKRVPTELVVGAIGALAEGLGIRAVARVFEVDPTTVLQWLVGAADQLQAFSQYFLHDVPVTPVQLDALYAVLRAVKAGEVSDTEALQCLSRSPHWVWAAIDPITKLRLTIDVGDRTRAMAQRVVHQVAQVLAPGCVPLFLTDGFKEYTTALLTHYGHWVQPARQRAQGLAPKPRWMPLPQLLSAQVIKTVRRRRLVRVRHRVVVGTLEAVQQVLAACGWQINTAFIERVNLSIRQHVATVGRRVLTLCKGEDGLRQQWALYHVYHNFCLLHASLRVPLPQPCRPTGRAQPRRGGRGPQRWPLG
jgi:IS1 family transposase